MNPDQIILFGAGYELPAWKRAFRKHDLRVVYWDINDLTDLGLEYSNNGHRLFVSGENKAVWEPVAGIWRIGAVKPPWQFTPSLEILKSVEYKFPMLTKPSTHLVCARRIQMHSKLVNNTALPMVKLNAFVTGRYLIEASYSPDFPVVLKIGNYEGGLKKWKIADKEQWSDFFDSIRAFDEPIIIEEYVDFHTEYRSLFVGDDIYVIKREQIEGWRAQHAKSSKIVKPTDEIIEMTNQAKRAIDIEVGALDFVEGKDGYTVFEVNDCPDLNPQRLGIEDNLWDKSAQILADKIDQLSE